MKLAVIGATGFVGAAVVKEALDRKHEVTAIARNPEKLNLEHNKLSLKKADAYKTPELTQVLKDHEVVINAFNAGWENPNLYDDYRKGATSIQQAVKDAGVKRLITVGGAGSLYVDKKTQLIDTPEFPEHIKAGASAARDYLEEIQKEDKLDWTYFSPAPGMVPGTPPSRTGKYRLGLENPVMDNKGQSNISVEDAAVALIDEAETGKHIRKRFTAGY